MAAGIGSRGAAAAWAAAAGAGAAAASAAAADELLIAAPEPLISTRGEKLG